MKSFFAYLILLFSFVFSKAQQADSLKKTTTQISFRYSQVPSILQGMYRYSLITEETDQWKKSLAIQQTQESLTPLQLQDNSFQENYNYIRNTASKTSYEIDLASDLDLYYAVWRAKLITINNESELKQLSNYGAEYLISKGYSIEEILPFLSLLLQEQHDYHYDNTRTKPFGKNAKGLYTTVEVLQAFNNYKQAEKIGVCRDVHEVALRMLREIGTTYYSNLYPEKHINIDDYLFLTSWATQSSQHVTVSFIDPLNTKKTYELDWGRLIEKNNNIGYEHGRNYGNAYRVWKFDPKKNFVKPIDSKKTSLGNFFDDQLYTGSEFDAMAGIKFVETYSDFKFEKKLNKKFTINSSIGTLSQNQKFAQATFSARFKEKKLGPLFLHNHTLAFQTLALEETEKKNLMFPINDYDASGALYFFPRYIGNLKTKAFKLSNHITCNFFVVASTEVILYLNAYIESNSKEKSKSKSGDAGIYFSQGYQINYINSNLEAELKLQNRSFLMAKDVRLLSPNPIELLSNAKLVNPAQGVFFQLKKIFFNTAFIRSKSVVEYTNQKNIITDNQIEIQNKINKIGFVNLSVAACKNLKGIQYFWYAVNRNKIELNYLNKKQTLKAGINAQQYQKNEWYFGTQINYNL